MAKQTASDAATAAVSSEEPAADNSEALTPTGAGDQGMEQSAGASINLSPELRDQLTRELQQALHQIETGFDTLTKPSDIAMAGTVFHVIDGVVIDDYLDKRTGELTSKVVFRLQYEDGRVVNVMQSAARPRLVIAKACQAARALGGRFIAGPYKYVKKGVGQIQDAVIFEQQSGWKMSVQ